MLQRSYKGIDSRLIGSSRARRRHHAAAKLAHDFFPGCCVFGDICEIERVEHQPCRLRALVMASHTVLIDEGALLRKSGSGKQDYEQETVECEPQITPPSDCKNDLRFTAL